MKKLKIASTMLYTVGILAILFGLVYLFTPKIMPYHEKFIGVPFNTLPPKVALLMLFFLKGAGGTCLSIGITLIMLVKGPFSKGDKYIRLVILIMLLTALLPLVYITLAIGLFTPWWLVGIMIIMVIIAFIISGKE